MGIPGSQLEKSEEKEDQSVLQFATDGLQVQCLAVTLAGGSLAPEQLVPLRGPKEMITVTHRKKENTVADVICVGERRLQEVFLPAMLAAKHGPWFSAWPAHELLLARFPALFLVSFQQDELRLGTVDGEAPVAALEPEPTPLATFCWQTVSRLWLKHQAEKKATSPCVSGVSSSVVFFYIF